MGEIGDEGRDSTNRPWALDAQDHGPAIRQEAAEPDEAAPDCVHADHRLVLVEEDLAHAILAGEPDGLDPVHLLAEDAVQLSVSARGAVAARRRGRCRGRVQEAEALHPGGLVSFS